MFTRALKVCDPHYLDDEISHIKNTFKKLCYPSHFINDALALARRKFYNKTDKTTSSDKKYSTLPFHSDFNKVSRIINRTGNIHLAFSYDNSIRSKLPKNNSGSDNNRQFNDANVCNTYRGHTNNTRNSTYVDPENRTNDRQRNNKKDDIGVYVIQCK